MFNQSGITKVTGGMTKQIVLFPTNTIAFGIVVSRTLATLDATSGQYIIPAGTPVTGDLDARTTPFTAATELAVVGVLQHDVVLGATGDGNASIVVEGWINTNRLTAGVKTALTTAIKALLKSTGVKFIAA